MSQRERQERMGKWPRVGPEPGLSLIYGMMPYPTEPRRPLLLWIFDYRNTTFQCQQIYPSLWGATSSPTVGLRGELFTLCLAQVSSVLFSRLMISECRENVRTSQFRLGAGHSCLSAPLWSPWVGLGCPHLSNGRGRWLRAVCVKPPESKQHKLHTLHRNDEILLFCVEQWCRGWQR